MGEKGTATRERGNAKTNHTPLGSLPLINNTPFARECSPIKRGLTGGVTVQQLQSLLDQ